MQIKTAIREQMAVDFFILYVQTGSVNLYYQIN